MHLRLLKRHHRWHAYRINLSILFIESEYFCFSISSGGFLCLDTAHTSCLKVTCLSASSFFRRTRSTCNGSRFSSSHYGCSHPRQLVLPIRCLPLEMPHGTYGLLCVMFDHSRHQRLLWNFISLHSDPSCISVQLCTLPQASVSLTFILISQSSSLKVMQFPFIFSSLVS